MHQIYYIVLLLLACTVPSYTIGRYRRTVNSNMVYAGFIPMLYYTHITSDHDFQIYCGQKHPWLV